MRRMLMLLVIVLTGCGAPTNAEPTTGAAVATVVPTVAPTQLPVVGATRRDAFGVEQVWVPAGSFMMGSDGTPAEAPPRWANLANEQPAHPVTITNGFWLDMYEVTHASFGQFAASGGYTNTALWSEDGLTWLKTQKVERLPLKCTPMEDTSPQACMSWYEAEAYATWRGGRLPTEAEWEYAARGAENRVFPWGNEFDPAKTNLVNSNGLTPVGAYPAGVSWVGAFDMTGNVMEWVQDWYAEDYYQAGAMTDPQGADSGKIKVKKGGWWGAPAFAGRASFRHEEDKPDYRDKHIGFRIVTP